MNCEKEKAVHELLKCAPCKIYDQWLEQHASERIVNIDFLAELLLERGQLPRSYYDNDSVSLREQVRKYYGNEAVVAIDRNLIGK